MKSWKTFSILVITFVFTIIMTAASPAFAIGTTGYDVQVQTGCEGGSGTNANIEVSLYNETLDVGTGFQSLDTLGTNDFQKCSNKTYNLRNLTDIDTPTEVTLKSDNSGAGPSWKVDWVKINAGTGNSQLCNFYAWFDKDHKQITKQCQPD